LRPPRLPPARHAIVALVAAAGLPAGSASTAIAHTSAIERAEAAAIGPEHAAEHEAERVAQQRWARLSSAQRSRITRRGAARAERYATATAGNAARVGRWAPSAIRFPSYAINAVLLRTGKVLFWDRAPRNPGAVNTNDRSNVSRAFLWNPARPKRAARDVTPKVDFNGDGTINAADNVPLFCSGQSLLPSGEVFAAGGTLAYPGIKGPDWAGARFAFTFDPWTERWTRQPDMVHGRWYPGQVELSDGRIAVLSGWDETGSGADNSALEVFTPAKRRGGIGSWQRFPAGNLATGYYPHLITMPSGEVMLAGPYAEDSAALKPSLLRSSTTPGSAWQDLPNLAHYHNAGNAVLLPGGPAGSMRVGMIGGFEEVAPGVNRSVRVSETFDTSRPGQGWVLATGASSSVTPALNVARSNGNVVLLPDGSLVAVGGAAGKQDPEGQNWTNAQQDLKRVELYRPGRDRTWRLGPAQRKWRTYHSTALLLPDGRVLSAGDDYWALGDVPGYYSSRDDAEIYSPPYLFDRGGGTAKRPKIRKAPGSLRYKRAFSVRVRGSARRAVLVAPAAVTHGADMNQRHVELRVKRRRGGALSLQSPPSTSVAPPGWYMLFVLDSRGTPSTARWIRVRR
jgi:hypothetical protein